MRSPGSKAWGEKMVLRGNGHVIRELLLFYDVIVG